MCCDWRYERDLCARGRGSELRTRTPSMLEHVRCCNGGGKACLPYSNAKANSGTAGGGVASVWKKRCRVVPYPHGIENDEDGIEKRPPPLDISLDMFLARRGKAMVVVVGDVSVVGRLSYVNGRQQYGEQFDPRALFRLSSVPVYIDALPRHVSRPRRLHSA